MSKQVQFKVSLIAATISMMMAGSAFAVAPVGNTLVGPDVQASSATVNVNIDQVGTNVMSLNVDTGVDAFRLRDYGNGGTVNLTVQQISSTSTSAADANKIGMSSVSTTDTSKTTAIKVYQGYDSAGNGTGTLTTVKGNKATLDIVSIDDTASSSTIQVSQQSDGNTATVTLGNSTGFNGVLNLVQMNNGTAGAGNTATVTLNGTSGQTFNVGQNGTGNTLALTAGLVGSAVTVNFGGVNFTTPPTATVDGAVTANNAKDSFTGSYGSGINLGSINGFDLAVNGSSNKINVDLGVAGTTSSVSGLVMGSDSTMTLSAANSGVLTLDGFTIADSANVKIKTFGTSDNSAGVAIYGKSTGNTGTLSTTPTLGTSTIVQGGIKDSITIGLNGTTGSTWNVAQSGGDTYGSTLSFDNKTNNAGIYVRQDSTAAAQSATGISFAAASGSTFTLYQK